MPNIETESDEMTDADLERLMILSIHKEVKSSQLRHHMRMLIKECKRLRGQVMIYQATRQRK